MIETEKKSKRMQLEIAFLGKLIYFIIYLFHTTVVVESHLQT